MMRFYQTFIFVFIILFLLDVPAKAKDTDCSNKTGDAVLKACAKILKTQLYQGKKLSDLQHSITYDNIGIEYMRRQQFERAIENFKKRS